MGKTTTDRASEPVRDTEFRNKPTLPAPPGSFGSLRPSAPAHTSGETRISSRPGSLGQISDVDFVRARVRILLSQLSQEERSALLVELCAENV